MADQRRPGDAPDLAGVALRPASTAIAPMEWPPRTARLPGGTQVASTAERSSASASVEKAPRRGTAPAVAAEVEGDDAEVARQLDDLRVPHAQRAGPAVEEHEGGPRLVAEDLDVELGAVA